MDNQKIRCEALGHGGDLGIVWRHDAPNSISFTDNGEGRIRMQYGAVPYFLYVLSQHFEMFDFLTKEQKSEILKSDYISFAAMSTRSFESDVKMNLEGAPKYVWEGKNEEGEVIEEGWLKKLRDGRGIAQIMTVFEGKGIKSNQLSFLGVVSGGNQFGYEPIYFSTNGNLTYLAQPWKTQRDSNGVNAVVLEQEDSKHLAREIVDMYGTSVSSALRSLLEKRK